MHSTLSVLAVLLGVASLIALYWAMGPDDDDEEDDFEDDDGGLGRVI